MRGDTIGRAVGALAAAVLLAGVWLPSGVEGAPRLEVRPEKVDLGSIPQGETRRKLFYLRNAGDETLVIEQIRPSCAECMVDRVKAGPLEPGEEFELPVTYRAAPAPGKYTAYVTLHTNDPVEPLKRIYLSVEITARGDRPRAELESVEVNAGILLADVPSRRVVKVRNAGNAVLLLDEVVAGPLASLEGTPPRELAPGEECAIAFRLRRKEPGILRTHLTFATNDPEQRTVTATVFGYVATPQELERLTPGIVIVPMRSARKDGRPAAVRVVNNHETPVWVLCGGGAPESRLVLAPGQSSTLEVRPEAAGAEGRVSLEVVLPAQAGLLDRPEGGS